jgi:hypothetical protein
MFIKIILLFLILLIININISFSFYLPDEIIKLPGWDFELPSRQFSGYLNVTDIDENGAINYLHYHYWFVLSELDTINNPLVMWFNGGPGCSSLDGFFYEQGPFEIVRKSHDSQRNDVDGVVLKLRPYRWNRLANMLFIEAPVGVGFSYQQSGNYSNNDDNTAHRNLLALEEFYIMFPSFLANDLYITGESYAGIYIPTLAESLLQAKESNTYHGGELKGIAVGNGCTGYEIGICGWYNSYTCDGLFYQTKFLLGLGFINQDLKDQINDNCDWGACLSRPFSYDPDTPYDELMSQGVSNITNNFPLNDTCMDLLDLASLELGFINIYNVFGTCTFDSCDGPIENIPNGKLGARTPRTSPLLSKQDAKTRVFSRLNKQKTRQLYNRKLEEEEEDYDSAIRGPVGCIDSNLATTYLMNPLVQHAIHVKNPGYCWAVCNNAPGFTYLPTRKNLPRDTYPYLIKYIDVTIYNGDWDACVPYTDNQAWTENMGFPALKPWSPW